jgi:hypothetical protein
MDIMRRLALVGAMSIIAMLAEVPHPDLAHVRKIYVLSMGSGLDQYIANHLAETGLFEITTDPAVADAILTDSVGETFERRLKELYPPPPPPETADKSAESGSKDAKKKESEPVTMYSFKDERPLSSFSRGRGNIFLVDRSTRKVVWSTYDRPKSRTPDELNHVGDTIAKQLKKAATAGTKQ